MKYKNLTIIGTSHISPKSVKQVKDKIKELKPEIIAVELDKKRYYALTTKTNKNISLAYIKKIGLKGFLFALLGKWAEKKLGQVTGIAPGTEMLTAINLAKTTKTPLSFIDQDIDITLKKLSKAITWKEKFNFISDIFKAIILRKVEIDFDIRNVPEEKIIQKLIEKVKIRYPSIYKVLIQQRNVILSKNLFHLMLSNKKILAIIGAGHQTEVIELIKDREAIHSASKIKQNT